MKTIKTLLIAVTMFLGANQAIQAQAKVAHINVQELMTEMPEMKNAQAQIKKIAESYDKSYTTMVTEYQTKASKYDAEQNTVNEAENKKRVAEIQDMGQRIQAFQQNAEKELSQKQMDLLKPITEKAQAAIAKVAKAKGYQYVLDATIGGTVIVADGPNILSDVKKELGF